MKEQEENKEQNSRTHYGNDKRLLKRRVSFKDNKLELDNVILITKIFLFLE